MVWKPGSEGGIGNSWHLGSTSRQRDSTPCICGVCALEISVNFRL